MDRVIQTLTWKLLFYSVHSSRAHFKGDQHLDRQHLAHPTGFVGNALNSRKADRSCCGIDCLEKSLSSNRITELKVISGYSFMQVLQLRLVRKVYKSNFHYKHSRLDICLFEIMQGLVNINLLSNDKSS